MDEMEEREIIKLTDEDGNEEEYEFLEVMEFEGKNYVVLCSVEELDGDQDVVIFETTPIPGNDEEEEYADIDDETYDRVYSAFASRFAEKYDFR